MGKKVKSALIFKIKNQIQKILSFSSHLELYSKPPSTQDSLSMPMPLREFQWKIFRSIVLFNRSKGMMVESKAVCMPLEIDFGGSSLKDSSEHITERAALVPCAGLGQHSWELKEPSISSWVGPLFFLIPVYLPPNTGLWF